MEKDSSVELEHVRRLLRDKTVPELEGELAENPLLREIHNELKVIRETVLAFSAGNFSPAIGVRGIIPGGLKELQAHLRHMIWQVQMVEKGDFSQKLHFMGEFSEAFNNMIKQFDRTLSDLRQKEEILLELRNTVNHHNSTMEALLESEAHFKYLANHDALTGVLNRRSFMEITAAQLKSAARNGIDCCLVMMDIDHFKLFNDTYGHAAGDEALRHIVGVVSEGLRRDDFLGRYGGEEFILFFYDSDEKTGMAIAERLRAALEDSPVRFDQQEARITSSFGIAHVRGAVRSDYETGGKDYVRSILNNADLALYEAKRTGRNKVVLYGAKCAGKLHENLEGENPEPLRAAQA
jgi:diguanylate cyclase (GGDEF)-like protein